MACSEEYDCTGRTVVVWGRHYGSVGGEREGGTEGRKEGLEVY